MFVAELNQNNPPAEVKKMKILLINSVCGIRSTGRICTDIADVLSAQGHECKIAYGRETVPEKYKKYAIRIGADFDVKMHGIQSRLFDNHGFGSKRATEKFIKWVKVFDPDVIHLHNIHGYYINIEVLFRYLKDCGKKIIWTLHDCWAFTGHCTHFTAIKCVQWKVHCTRCVQKKQYPKSLYRDNSYWNFEKKKQLFISVPKLMIVTPSFWLSSLLKDSFLKDYPVEVIHNGIDLDVFKRTESELCERYGLEGKKIILGVASVWDERKGLNDFIKLSSMIDEVYQIVLIGLSSIQITKLPQKIIGIKRTNSVTELAQWYSTADVYLNLTYEDNYPTVNLEAQACGTPVVTYRTGGSVESVIPNNIIEVGDVESVKNILSKIECKMTDIDYSAEAAIEKYIDVYRR